MATDPEQDDAMFERLAARSDPPDLSAPVRLTNAVFASLAGRQQDDTNFETLAAAPFAAPVPPALKSRIYSKLVEKQAASGALLSLTAVKRGGRQLCVFEELVRIAPVGEELKSRNPCRVCHARILGERLDAAPLYWPHCPYSEFHNP